jgi:SAM-dependent methyltransferase
MFGHLFANWYDRWHVTKDYGSEVDQLIELFVKEGQVSSVLDLGCGTGRHVELLADAGYEVVGVDRSEQMVRHARERVSARAEVVHSDIVDLALDRTFDAAIMMFSVLGYLVTDEALQAALESVHRHLRPDGLFLFDILDGSAVLRREPRGGFTRIPDGDAELVRVVLGSVADEEGLFRQDIQMWHLAGGRVVDHVKENHEIRYFLPRELELLLQRGGFELLDTAPVAGGQPGPARQWSRLAWARRV